MGFSTGSPAYKLEAFVLSRRRRVGAAAKAARATPLWLALSLMCCLTAAAAQEQTAAAAGGAAARVRKVASAAPAEAALASGERHEYQVPLRAGQALRVVVGQQGVDVILTLFGPRGEKLKEVDFTKTRERLTWVAGAPGAYRLEVSRFDGAGTYRIEFPPPRTATAEDAALAAAEESYIRADALRNQGTPDALREAARDYERARQVWHAAGEPVLEATALYHTGMAHERLGEREPALAHYEQALTLSVAAGDARGEALSSASAGSLSRQLGDARKAVKLLTAALPKFQSLGDRNWEAYVLFYLGESYRDLGERPRALDHFARALTHFKTSGNRVWEGMALEQMAGVHVALNEREKALELYARALALHRGAKDARAEATTLYNLGKFYQEGRQHPQALEHFGQSLALFRAAADAGWVAAVLSSLAETHGEAGEPEKAAEHFAQALALYRAAGNQVGEGAVLFATAMAYERSGQHRKALEFYALALPLKQAVGDRRGEADALNNSGLNHARLGEREKAFEFYNRALPIYRQAGHPYGEATTLSNIAKEHKDAGNAREALGYYEQAAAAYRRVPDKAWESVMLKTMGDIHLAAGESPKALEYFEAALRLAAGDAKSEAVVLTDIGGLYHGTGENRKALGLLERALALHRGAANPAGEAATLTVMARVYDTLGEKQKAVELYGRSLQLHRDARNREWETGTLFALGQLYGSVDEMQKALEQYDRALKAYRAANDHRNEAAVLTGVGAIHDKLGDRQKALGYLTSALPLHRAAGNRDGEAFTLLFMGVVYGNMGEWRRALDICEQALRLHRATHNADGEAGALLQLGLAHLELGERRKALESYEQALPLFRRIGHRAGEAAVLIRLAQYHFQAGDQQQALAYSALALPLFHAAGHRNGEAATHGFIMTVYQTLGEPGAAILHGKLAVNVLQQVRGSIRELDKESQKSFLSSVKDPYRALADLLISQGRAAEAVQSLDLLKLEEAADYAGPAGGVGPARGPLVTLTPEEETWAKFLAETLNPAAADLLGRHEALAARGARTPEEEKQFEALGREVERLRAVTQEKLQSFLAEHGKGGAAAGAARQAAAVPNPMTEVVRELGPGVVAVYTVVGEERYSAIVTTAEGTFAHQTPIKRAELERKVKQFYDALQSPRLDPKPQARELYKLLVAPVERHLQRAGAQTVMWSLDGVLRYVPVGALHDGRQYLVEKFRHAVVSPTSRGKLLARRTGPWSALGVGTSKDYGLGALPGVREELRGVIRARAEAGATGVVPGEVMLDEEFTEQSMLAALRRGFKVVHIASHFSLNPGDMTQSYLLAGDGGRVTLARLRAVPDIFRGVELVTLSACDTARGSRGGDGREIDGLGIVAQEEGAQAVLASLWKVADRSTTLLMRGFYENVGERGQLTKAEALRRAQVALLRGAAAAPLSDATRGAAADPAWVEEEEPGRPFKENPKAPYAHPYYWAPFILIGNWR